MKSIFLLGTFLTLLLTGGMNEASHDQKQFQKLNQFIEKPTVPGFVKLEEFFEQQIESMGTGQLIKWEKTQKESLFLDAIKVYFTHLLPKNFPGRIIYLTCFSDLHVLMKDLTQSKSFLSYQACLDHQFNNDLPPNYKELLGALKKLSQ